jgi:hypothetical protein
MQFVLYLFTTKKTVFGTVNGFNKKRIIVYCVQHTRCAYLGIETNNF